MIEIVWGRIKESEGDIFTQIRGKRFTYKVKGNLLKLDTTNRSISKTVILQALEFVPLSNTVPVQHLQAPSYIYAILMDKRIRQDNW